MTLIRRVNNEHLNRN